jgi:hypothetical protein
MLLTKHAAQTLQNHGMPIRDHDANTTHWAVLSLSPHQLNHDCFPLD